VIIEIVSVVLMLVLSMVFVEMAPYSFRRSKAPQVAMEFTYLQKKEKAMKALSVTRLA